MNICRPNITERAHVRKSRIIFKGRPEHTSSTHVIKPWQLKAVLNKLLNISSLVLFGASMLRLRMWVCGCVCLCLSVSLCLSVPICLPVCLLSLSLSASLSVCLKNKSHPDRNHTGGLKAQQQLRPLRFVVVVVASNKKLPQCFFVLFFLFRLHE